MGQEFTEEQLKEVLLLCEQLEQERHQKGFTTRELCAALGLDWQRPYHQVKARRMAVILQRTGHTEAVPGLERKDLYGRRTTVGGWRLRKETP